LVKHKLSLDVKVVLRQLDLTLEQWERFDAVVLPGNYLPGAAAAAASDDGAPEDPRRGLDRPSP
jgi:hypothetical protein